MRLDQLVSENYHKLNENDILIWGYIQRHKKECCSISIEELAKECCISRTTISRFTQKLSFDGFREFKVHLKLEYEQEQTQSEVLLEDVCANYIKCIQLTKESDMREICEKIYSAKRLFVFGTGEVQNAAAQMLKRMFMYTKRFFVELSGKNELMMALEDMGQEDLMIILSLSGESELAVEAAKKLKTRGTYLISITQLSNNTVARLSNKNLYLVTNKLMNIGGRFVETSSPYFNIVELMWVNYLAYLNTK